MSIIRATCVSKEWHAHYRACSICTYCLTIHAYTVIHALCSVHMHTQSMLCIFKDSNPQVDFQNECITAILMKTCIYIPTPT